MKNNIIKVTLNFLKRNNFIFKANKISLENKSRIIYTILAGIPLPLIIVEEKKDAFNVITGGDYIDAILQFLNGKFALVKDELLNKFIKEDLSNKTFNDFSDDLKEEFLETEIAISVFRSLRKSEKDVIIKIIDNKKVVNTDTDTDTNAKTKTKANTKANTKAKTKQKKSTSSTKSNNNAEKAISPVEKQLEEILNHPFFEKVHVRPITTNLIIPFLMVSNDGAEKALSTKNIQKFKENMNEVPNINKELDFLNKAYQEKTTYLKKIHLPMIFNCARNALNSNITPTKFKNIIDQFFDENIPEYKKACDNGTSSKTNVNTRTTVMLKFFNKNI